ncbi:tRNA preQ1(34) S-adenosylmethionine ribosyltransferase-isomerase QueA [Desulfocurvus sp. DL9XJH121]
MIPEDFLLDSYRYELPQDRIAQAPAENRDGSKLMVLDRATGETLPTAFTKIAQYIPENALLVVNNTKVLPARVYGTKDSGGRVEFLILTPLPLIEAQGPDAEGMYWADVQGLLRASKAPKSGQRVTFSENFSLLVQERGDFGQSRVRLFWRGELAGLFKTLGHYPLPPYIKRPDTPEDAERYQTVYASENKLGSVAAPTAGLHFTPEVRKSLSERNAKWAEITLYVGYGTFSPVRCRDIRDHEMHREYIEVPEDTARAVSEAKAEGRPVVAVGTTSVRALEGAFAARGRMEAFAGWTSIYISPGYTFKIVDKIITNFHLPESSLLIMVSAFAGRSKILNAYSKALFEGFRFFSYGDAMLIT